MYRWLLPHQPLIFGGHGAALSQNTKRRTLETGERRDYKAFYSLQSHKILYKRAGFKGGLSHSVRRLFAGKVLASSGDIEDLARLLGHFSIECRQRYVDVQTDVFCKVFEAAL